MGAFLAVLRLSWDALSSKNTVKNNSKRMFKQTLYFATAAQVFELVALPYFSIQDCIFVQLQLPCGALRAVSRPSACSEPTHFLNRRSQRVSPKAMLRVWLEAKSIWWNRSLDHPCCRRSLTAFRMVSWTHAREHLQTSSKRRSAFWRINLTSGVAKHILIYEKF